MQLEALECIKLCQNFSFPDCDPHLHENLYDCSPGNQILFVQSYRQTKIKT